MRSMQETFQTIQQEMYQAAKEEDYILASQLKDQRDQARETLLEAQDDDGDFGSDYVYAIYSHLMEDMSFSTISIEDPPTTSNAREKIDRSDGEREAR